MTVGVRGIIGVGVGVDLGVGTGINVEVLRDVDCGWSVGVTTISAVGVGVGIVMALGPSLQAPRMRHGRIATHTVSSTFFMSYSCTTLTFAAEVLLLESPVQL